MFVPLIRGSLDYARDDDTRSVVFYKEGRPFQEILRVFSNPLNDGPTLEMTFFGGNRHFDQVKRVEKSPKAKQNFIACYHTRRYKFLEGFSIYAKAFDMCYRTRYALKGVVVIKEYRHFDQTKCVEKSPKAKPYYPLQSIHLILSFRA